MTTQPMTILIPPYGTARLNLPTCLTPDAFARLDAAISGVLGDGGRRAAAGPANDPGAVEFASWAADRH